MIRFGILGCGSASIPVAQAVSALEEAQLVGLYDANRDLAIDLAGRFGGKVWAAAEDFLQDPQIDAVYIAVPHDLLYPFARQAIEAGRHVLVEKPMALGLEQADALIQAAEQHRCGLGVFYEMRQTDPIQTARRMVQSGAIGQVIGVRIQTLVDKPPSYWTSGYTGRLSSPWRAQRSRAGGGVLLMNTSHLLEAVFYITSLEVVRVTAEAGTLLAAVEVEDLAAATLLFDNGAIGSIYAGAHLAGAGTGDECFEIFGSYGQLKIPDPYGSGSLQVFLRQEWEGLSDGIWHSLPARPVQVYQAAIREFIQSIASGIPPPTGGREARRVLATILAIYQAAAENRPILIREENKSDQK